jgi:hypothetical protein
MDRLVNLVKIALINKKNLIKTKFNKKEIKLLKLLLKINLISFVKIINRSNILIKINTNFNFKIKNLFKKKKLSIKKKNIKKQNIIIISNSSGISILKNRGGVML